MNSDELKERLAVIETKLDLFLNHHKEIIKEVKNNADKLAEEIGSHKVEIAKLQTEIKWFAKIPLTIMIGLNIMLSLLTLIRVLK